MIGIAQWREDRKKKNVPNMIPSNQTKWQKDQQGVSTLCVCPACGHTEWIPDCTNDVECIECYRDWESELNADRRYVRDFGR